KKRFFIQVLGSVVLAMGVAAYFWIPALLEKKYTMVNLLVTELAHYSIHFVAPIQFWYSPWGYGGSTFGLNDGLSFQIGKAHLLLFVVSVICLVGNKIVRKKKIDT